MTDTKKTLGQKIIANRNKIGLAALAIAVLLSILFPEFASAYDAPTSTDAGYKLYDVVVTQGIQGVPGFVAAAWLFVNAGITIGNNPKLAALQAIGGGVLIQADSIAKSLGYHATEVASYFNHLI